MQEVKAHVDNSTYGHWRMLQRSEGCDRQTVGTFVQGDLAVWVGGWGTVNPMTMHRLFVVAQAPLAGVDTGHRQDIGIDTEVECVDSVGEGMNIHIVDFVVVDTGVNPESTLAHIRKGMTHLDRTHCSQYNFRFRIVPLSPFRRISRSEGKLGRAV